MTNSAPQAINAKSVIRLNGNEDAWMPVSCRNIHAGNERGLVLVPVAVKAGRADTGFVQMVINIVEKHLSNYKFNIQTLAVGLGMSRRQLFRKFKAIAGCTPNFFIRNLRLQHAADLLRSTRMTVLEITYVVGFCDPKYFRALFKRKYGVLPSVYANSLPPVQYNNPAKTTKFIPQPNKINDENQKNSDGLGFGPDRRHGARCHPLYLLRPR
jgi:AraC-like DNA-binding protein